MKQPIKVTEAIFPMPVLLVATYNEDGTIDVMNAAWGTMLDRDRVALNLTETHKTVENIKQRKDFVVHIADAAHVVEADYFGVVSGKTEKDKFAKSGLTATKSSLVEPNPHWWMLLLSTNCLSPWSASSLNTKATTRALVSSEKCCRPPSRRTR